MGTVGQIILYTVHSTRCQRHRGISATKQQENEDTTTTTSCGRIDAGMKDIVLLTPHLSQHPYMEAHSTYLYIQERNCMLRTFRRYMQICEFYALLPTDIESNEKKEKFYFDALNLNNSGSSKS